MVITYQGATKTINYQIKPRLGTYRTNYVNLYYDENFVGTKAYSDWTLEILADSLVNINGKDYFYGDDINGSAPWYIDDGNLFVGDRSGRPGYTYDISFTSVNEFDMPIYISSGQDYDNDLQTTYKQVYGHFVFVE